MTLSILVYVGRTELVHMTLISLLQFWIGRQPFFNFIVSARANIVFRHRLKCFLNSHRAFFFFLQQPPL